jgi:NAD dependent epimerase/dehydratase
MSIKKILVTGGCGFIGSHLVEHLVEKGYEVKAFDRYNSENNWGWLEASKLKGNFEVLLGDIRDFDSVYNATKGCDSIIHLAALIGIPYSYISPLAYIKTNVEGVYNILEASKMRSIANIITTSTSEVYGSGVEFPMNENHRLLGQSPYSASKIAADQISISYFRSFDLPVKIIRPFNTYGPRQSARAIIPTIFSQIYSNYKSISLGNLYSSRDFTFVSDTCYAFEKLLLCNKKQAYGNIFNVGSSQEITIKDLVEKIKNITNKDLNIKTEKKRIRKKNSEVSRLKCDFSKFQKLTNWKPKYSLNMGLKEFDIWLKSNLHLYKPNQYNV